jgi:subfamily B ATP-binding cassette protein MsbA
MVFFPLCVIPMMVLGRKARRAGKGNRKSGVSQQSLLVEFLASIRVVKAYNLEAEQSRRFARYSRELIHHAMKNLQARELVNPLIETIGAVGLALLLLYLLYTGRSGSDLAIFIAAVATVYTPVKKLASVHVMFQQTSVGVDRLFYILDQQPTVKEPARPRKIERFQGDVRFENVSFGYGEAPVLRQLNLSIPRGMKLGIAGESGSGKSTLINLLFRFYDPTGGRILIDGIDIREISTGDLHSQMALVSQEIVLFDQTVRENIACGKPGAGPAEVEAAARAAFAHEFIMQLPQQYETRVGERGVMLSGGQRQRIAIARAFIRQAPILALDEATAALDAQSEAEVQGAIDRLAENRTVIAVAHRLSTLSKMDKIIVLKEGELIEQGAFSDLLKGKGVFGAMAERQSLAAAAR